MTLIVGFVIDNNRLIWIDILIVLHAFYLSWRCRCAWAIYISLLILFLTVLIHLWIILMNRNELFYIRRFSVRSWRQQTSIRWRIFIFLIIIHHLRKIKSVNFLVIYNRLIITFLFDTCLWSFWAYRNLKILKSDISFNYSLNRSHIRISIDMESFNILAYMVRTLPLLYSLEKTEIYNK